MTDYIERERIVGLAESRGEFVTDVDGFVYYWPDGSCSGHLSSYHLRLLADELDKRNESMNQQIQQYFESHNAT